MARAGAACTVVTGAGGASMRTGGGVEACTCSRSGAGRGAGASGGGAKAGVACTFWAA